MVLERTTAMRFGVAELLATVACDDGQAEPSDAASAAPSAPTTTTAPRVSRTDPLRDRVPSGPEDRGVGHGLAACDTTTKLDVPPLAPGDFGMILPLGNLAPPDHTFPTDHIYYMLPREGDATRRVEVVAPGDVAVLSIDATAHLQDRKERFVEFSMSFAPCHDQLLKFGHLSSLSPDLITAPNNAERAFCNDYGVGEATYRYCSSAVQVELEAEVGAGPIHCYEGLASARPGYSGLGGRILSQLVNADELLVEHRDGTCSDELSFASPVRYER